MLTRGPDPWTDQNLRFLMIPSFLRHRKSLKIQFSPIDTLWKTLKGDGEEVWRRSRSRQEVGVDRDSPQRPYLFPFLTSKAPPTSPHKIPLPTCPRRGGEQAGSVEEAGRKWGVGGQEISQRYPACSPSLLLKPLLPPGFLSPTCPRRGGGQTGRMEERYRKCGGDLQEVRVRSPPKDHADSPPFEAPPTTRGKDSLHLLPVPKEERARQEVWRRQTGSVCLED